MWSKDNCLVVWYLSGNYSRWKLASDHPTCGTQEGSEESITILRVYEKRPGKGGGGEGGPRNIWKFIGVLWKQLNSLQHFVCKLYFLFLSHLCCGPEWLLSHCRRWRKELGAGKFDIIFIWDWDLDWAFKRFGAHFCRPLQWSILQSNLT